MRWLVILMALVVAPARAADCTDIYDVPWFGWTQFFSATAFGTVGFTRDGGAHVRVARPGTCITMGRSGRSLRFVFNHRGIDRAEVGYVSFKLYGLSGTSKTGTRLLERTGAWTRDGKQMPDPWKKLVPARPLPAVISDYEAFYRGDGAAAEVTFDQKFGILHGTPKNSGEDSWDDLGAMQPDAPDMTKIAYLAHSLQRVEVSPGTASPGVPPDYVTDRFEFDTLILHAFSPVGEGRSSTLIFKISD